VEDKKKGSFEIKVSIFWEQYIFTEKSSIFSLDLLQFHARHWRAPWSESKIAGNLMRKSKIVFENVLLSGNTDFNVSLTDQTKSLKENFFFKILDINYCQLANRILYLFHNSESLLHSIACLCKKLFSRPNLKQVRVMPWCRKFKRKVYFEWFGTYA